MKNKSDRFESILGILIIGGLLTGLVGLVGAVFAFFSAEWIGVGVCLGASGLAFGLTSNALLRD